MTTSTTRLSQSRTQSLTRLSQSLSQTSTLPFTFETETVARADFDEAWFHQHRARLTASFGKFMAWILLGAVALFWPTDSLLFPDRPEMHRFFNTWRPGIAALTVIYLVGARLFPLFTRRPAPVLTVILTLGAAICGYSVGSLGAFGEPFYSCGYILSLSTIPLVVGLRARVICNLSILLAYAGSYLVMHPGFVDGLFAGPTLLFHLFTAIAAGGVGHSIFVLVRSNFAQSERLAELAEEIARAREKSERLLLNILPQPVARQLKEGASTVADAYDDVSVMFIDICGFTTLANEASPEAVVRMLNRVFSRFDALVERHELEKIKTIGDAYMVAGGLPNTCADHPNAMAALALEVLECAQEILDPHGEPLRVRVGVHVGPVVAGVIGRKKFIYDLWGDTVNTASRMESQGTPGAIQISEALHDRLAPSFRRERRGPITVKGKGEMTTYFLLPREQPQRATG